MYKIQAPASAGVTDNVSMTAPEIATSGVPLDIKGDAVTISKPDQHVMILGASGRGKSRRAIYPSVVLSARAGRNLIICDPKGAVYRNTAEEVKRLGYDVKLLNLRDPALGSRWDPFHIAQKAWDDGDTSRAIAIVRDVSAAITSCIKSERDPYWHCAAQDSIAGFAVLMLHMSKHPTISQISVFLNDYMCTWRDRDYKAAIRKYGGPARGPLATLVGLETEITLGCVISETSSALSTYCDREDLREMLEASDFTVEDLVSKPTALYIVVPDESTILYGLAMLCVKQLYAELVRVADSSETGTLPIPVDFIIDEFGSYPGDDWAAKLTAARSRGIRYILALQSMSQLYDRYGRECANTIIDNCRTIVSLGGRDMTMMREMQGLEIPKLETGKVATIVDDAAVTIGNLPDWTEWNIKSQAKIEEMRREKSEDRKEYLHLYDLVHAKARADGFI